MWATRLATDTNGAVTNGSNRSWVGFLRRWLRPIRLNHACTSRSGSCLREYSAGPSGFWGWRTAVYKSRARLPNSAATCLHLNQVRGHINEFAGDFQLIGLHGLDGGSILLNEFHDIDIIEVHFIFANQIEQQIQRTFKIIFL